MSEYEPIIPLVSICVPVYGVERFIEQCAESLFNQTYRNIEYIFVNDCTKDKSIEILKTVLARYPNRKSQVHIINHITNQKLGNTRNTAVAAAEGEFIIHVDSDDYIDLNLVEKCVERQMNTNADIVYFDGIKYTKTKREILKRPDKPNKDQMLLETLRHSIPVSIWGLMIRKSLYDKNGIKVENNVNCSEDYMVTARLFYYAGKLAKIKGVYYNYNCTNEDSITTKRGINCVVDDLTVVDFLKNFYHDKEDKLREALKLGILELYTGDIIVSALNKNKYYFKELCNRLKEMDKSILKLIPSKFSIIRRMPPYAAYIYCNYGLSLKARIRNFELAKNNA